MAKAVLDVNVKRIIAFRNAFKSIVVFRSVEEAIWGLPKAEWSEVSLGHSMGQGDFVGFDNPKSGAELARWIAENRPVIDKVIIHSQDGRAAPKMRNLLKDAGYEVWLHPFEGTYRSVLGS